MKDAVIRIHSIHNNGADDDVIEFTTDGEYSYEAGVGRIRYMESEVTGIPGTQTCLEIRPDEVVVDRRGSITSRMVFRRGEKNLFQYSTPYGMATLGMDTRKIRHSFNEGGGSMEIDYILNVEHTVVARNQFQVKVTEQKENREKQTWQI